MVYEMATLGMSGSSEEYYLTMAVKSLMKILKDPSLYKYHNTLMSALMLMFKLVEQKNMLPFLPDIMPAVIHLISTTKEINLLRLYFKQLTELVAILKGNLRDYVDSIFGLIKDFWMDKPSNVVLFDAVMALVVEIAYALDNEFKVYLPALVPQLLDVFQK